MTPGFALTKSTRVPLGIHLDTSCSGIITTPKRGTTFGCRSLFQTTASSQKALYNVRANGAHQKSPLLHTAIVLFWLIVCVLWILNNLIHTFSFPRVPFHTSANPPYAMACSLVVFNPVEMMCDDGRMLWWRQTLRSLRRQRRNNGSVTEITSSAYNIRYSMQAERVLTAVWSYPVQEIH